MCTECDAMHDVTVGLAPGGVGVQVEGEPPVVLAWRQAIEFAAFLRAAAGVQARREGASADEIRRVLQETTDAATLAAHHQLHTPQGVAPVT